MPCVPLIQNGKQVGTVALVATFQPGDFAPSGYCDWHEWAKVQMRAGLRQVRCSRCERFKFPQELASNSSRGRAVCLKCSER